ncbi:hypothetical protein [Kitasatospora sp. GP82]|uniref:hypothetical protein n=1 Tax=Kitasatospora sp. GP82 TaxID=3035089 RepID=UPI002473319C|nr:hypothetical protein [Kitasatospora sp. GP82]
MVTQTLLVVQSAPDKSEGDSLAAIITAGAGLITAVAGAVTMVVGALRRSSQAAPSAAAAPAAE